MRIAIVGASGNVGTALLRAFTGAGHEVVALARRPPRRGPGSGAAGTYADRPGVEWHAVDLTHAPGGTLRRAFRGADAVVHLVWAFQPTHDQEYLERVDLGGTSEVLAAAADAGVRHVLHQSSLGAYSPGSGMATEDWPTQGVPSSWYSRHKATAERLLDDFDAAHPDTLVTRMRPVLIGQREAASGVLRYVLPAVVPARAVALAKLLPLDRDLRLQLIHADDVADAYVRAVEARVPGPFNLAAGPVLTPADVAAALGARHVHLPFRVLRTAVDLSWRAHLQQVDVGWLDMAWQLPQLDATRASIHLGWQPRKDAHAVLREVVSGIREGAYADTPILRRRTVADGLVKAFTGRPVAHRHKP